MLKKIARTFVLILLLCLAATGIGIFGVFQNRERPDNRKTTVERKDSKEDDDD